jgi:hypothetical protein
MAVLKPPPVLLRSTSAPLTVLANPVVLSRSAGTDGGLVTRTSTGEVQTVKYQELIPMLLNELRLRQELAELRAQGQGRGAAAETAALAR